ncbi:Fic family protein [Xylocopilactobacillus apis]|uniref:Cell division protein Fic n=1 Tax=Xylocopilactobacillus apis TaxID=2932183 RepID=A0AAU9DJQ9_9LACO|nr:Fic family protein [Xylocopilactobacillus apis]BDR57027.1 cell division protein Fic [Xylocopilactobacillus apis]
MKKFDYKTLNNLTITAEMAKKIALIFELRGKLSVSLKPKSVALDRLVEVAKIQSTDSSNRIEGIYTSQGRLRQLMAEKTMPQNRSEEEISGYRDVLKLILEQSEYMPLNSKTILTLHKHLFNFTSSSWAGKYKDSDNQIITNYKDGHSEIRFIPPSSTVTPELVDELCQKYTLALEEDHFVKILLVGAFVFDFVSIHPFNDGNGRMSRLLTLIFLYQNGYDVGKYISIEKLIERTKDQYYSSLQESSEGWSDNKNSYEPFLNYFLSVMLQAYRELTERIDFTEGTKHSAKELIFKNLENELRPLSKSELVALIPDYSQTTIERSLGELVAANRITKIGVGRATKYINRIV